jgi:energy-coupling factor transporter ATP-binding protein EcfA2
MNRAAPGALEEIPADPFGERQRAALHERMQLLGGEFHFEADSPRLLRIVQLAYANLPSHRLATAAPRFLVRLLLSSKTRSRRPTTSSREAIRTGSEPPRVRPLAGGGILCGAMESANFMALTPSQRSAVVVVSPAMLEFPYHIRYELLEFAVYMLAARVQRLVPLHAACVGAHDRGILLLGPSGSGKSTLALHCLLKGLDFLAEDSVLVKPEGLLATGVANFLHVRRDALRFLSDAGGAALIRKSAVIRRRSGVEKFEIDLRRPQYRLAPAPLRLGAVAFISPRSAGRRALLTPLGKVALAERIAAGQRYAASQPGWKLFATQVSRLPAFELRRGRHPSEAVEALRALLPRGR